MNQTEKPVRTDKNMRDLWLMVELSPFNVRPMVWYTMRKSGMTYTDIGKAFGVSRQAVHQEVSEFAKRYFIAK